jgi:hypothetical protein
VLLTAAELDAHLTPRGVDRARLRPPPAPGSNEQWAASARSAGSLGCAQRSSGHRQTHVRHPSRNAGPVCLFDGERTSPLIRCPLRTSCGCRAEVLVPVSFCVGVCGSQGRDTRLTRNSVRLTGRGPALPFWLMMVAGLLGGGGGVRRRTDHGVRRGAIGRIRL